MEQSAGNRNKLAVPVTKVRIIVSLTVL